MEDSGQGPGSSARSKRKDARRNQQTLLDAAAAVFVASGVEAPVRDIAAKAGVGMGTIYRHFPTRADLVIAVYRHQVDACAEAGPALLAASPTPHAALGRWVDLFVDFLVTKHGLAAAMQGTAPASRRCTPTSSTASCRCAPSSSKLPPPRARSTPTWTPINSCAASETSVSVPRATPATTCAAWSHSSSQDYAGRADRGAPESRSPHVDGPVLERDPGRRSKTQSPQRPAPGHR